MRYLEELGERSGLEIWVELEDERGYRFGRSKEKGGARDLGEEWKSNNIISTTSNIL